MTSGQETDRAYSNKKPQLPEPTQGREGTGEGEVCFHSSCQNLVPMACGAYRRQVSARGPTVAKDGPAKERTNNIYIKNYHTPK